jgi:membrane protein YqaA with SNARE-associated domain
MNPSPAALPWIFASCFGLSIASALLPWLNAEVVLLSYAALLRTPSELLALTLLVTGGQIAGKCVLYWFGLKAVRLTSRHQHLVERWRARLAGRRLYSVALVFASSAIGIPPLYITTLAAGAVRMAFSLFIGAAAAGRVLRFGALAFGSGTILRLLRGA